MLQPDDAGDLPLRYRRSGEVVQGQHVAQAVRAFCRERAMVARQVRDESPVGTLVI
jgi:hypothetical protein